VEGTTTIGVPGAAEGVVAAPEASTVSLRLQRGPRLHEDAASMIANNLRVTRASTMPSRWRPRKSVCTTAVPSLSLCATDCGACTRQDVGWVAR
jgi:hypothetical protein